VENANKGAMPPKTRNCRRWKVVPKVQAPGEGIDLSRRAARENRKDHGRNIMATSVQNLHHKRKLAEQEVVEYWGKILRERRETWGERSDRGKQRGY